MKCKCTICKVEGEFVESTDVVCLPCWDKLEAERDSALSQFRIHEEASLKLWAENKALREALEGVRTNT